ncbi:hypothetical protein [Streptomyces sp. NPDC047000]|uniref:hypothetical protein n=1 Tax=Streptomyces sp. NPDC047000 TaxID=3155474 RepID=UPI0033C87D3D
MDTDPRAPGDGCRAQRLELIARLVAHQTATTQSDLVTLLAERGIQVSQSTVSRDLTVLGIKLGKQAARRRPAAHAGIPAASWPTVKRLLVAAETSGGIVVLRTLPGAAKLLASLLDAAALPDVLGMVGGNDSVALVCRTPEKADHLAADLMAALAG